jgi:2,5-diketo-D-gluconate reductase B
MQTIESQGVDIPRLGFGTFRMPGGDAQPVVATAGDEIGLCRNRSA